MAKKKPTAAELLAAQPAKKQLKEAEWLWEFSQRHADCIAPGLVRKIGSGRHRVERCANALSPELASVVMKALKEFEGSPFVKAEFGRRLGQLSGKVRSGNSLRARVRPWARAWLAQNPGKSLSAAAAAFQSQSKGTSLSTVRRYLQKIDPQFD